MAFAKIKQHYEVVVAFCCFLILFTNIGLPSTSFSVYQPYLVDLPGVGHSGGSIIVSVRTFVSLLAMLVVGRYYDLLDCRAGACLASVFVSIGFLLYSLNTGNFPGLCAASVFTGLGYGLGGMIASTMLINRWFRVNVATVAGVAAVGSGVAAVIIPNSAVALIDAFGLSSAFAFEAALALVLGAVTFALLRNDPRDLGLKPYEGKAGEGSQTAGSRNAGEDKPARKRHANRDLSPKAMPLLLVAMVAIGCASVGGGNYLAVLFTSEGFSAESAAAMVAISGACLTVAKLASGVVFDRVGTRNGSIAFFALYIGGTAILCLSDMGNTGLAGAGAFMFGLGMSLGTVGISVWSIELAPRGKETRTIKNFQVCYALGGFIFTFLPGFLTEAFGTYLVSYVILLALLVVAAAIIISVYAATEKRAKEAA